MNKRKKILLFHHCDSLGGAGVSLLSIYNMLIEEYYVKLYIPNGNSQLYQYYKSHGVEINVFGDNIGMVSSYSGGPNILSRTFMRNLVKIKDSKKIFQDIIDIEKPDMIAVNSMTLAWAGKLIQRNSIKSLCFVRETYVGNLGMRYIKYSLNKWFDGVIFISEFDKKKFKCKASIVAIVRDNVHAVEYSIHLTREQACETLSISSNTFNILYVGGTSDLKGWTVILKTIEKLRDYDINLIVAGRTEIRKLVKNNLIKYIGERSDMPVVYRACDILVFPSTSPHQARPAFEAGFMGLPVIISDFEETSEQIQNEINGLTFSPLSSHQLAEKILRLYEDTELCKKLGQTNRDHSIQFHEFHTCKEKLLTIMSNIIE